MKVKFYGKLKHGFKKTMDIEETHEFEIVIEAENMVTASRIFKAIVDMENINEYGYYCI